ncbi:MAG: response regulator [Planctomycetota bacterium]
MSQLLDPVILVVDSDPVELAGTLSVLEHESYQVFGAGDPATALHLARELELDLIIMEMRVGETSGPGILDQIRKIEGREDVPAMFVTPNQASDVIHRVHQSGPAYHLRKPFQTRVLLELVARSMWLPHLVSNHIGNVFRAEPAADQTVRKPHLPLPGTTAPTLSGQTINAGG